MTTGEHPYLRAEDIAALARLLERDVRLHPHLISPRELARWMDADIRFASWVEEHQPGQAGAARPYRRTA